jgi:hypothetical protein
MADLCGRSGGLLEQNPQSRAVSVRATLFFDEQHSHQISPTEQLAPHGRSLSDSDREIHEA